MDGKIVGIEMKVKVVAFRDFSFLVFLFSLVPFLI
jgi:hypothetical protein